MIDSTAIIKLSEMDVRNGFEYKQIDAIRGGFRITLPNGTEWDLSVDKHSGNLTLHHPGSGQIVVIPHVSNSISVRVESC